MYVCIHIDVIICSRSPRRGGGASGRAAGWTDGPPALYSNFVVLLYCLYCCYCDSNYCIVVIVVIVVLLLACIVVILYCCYVVLLLLYFRLQSSDYNVCYCLYCCLRVCYVYAMVMLLFGVK